MATKQLKKEPVKMEKYEALYKRAFLISCGNSISLLIVSAFLAFNLKSFAYRDPLGLGLWVFDPSRFLDSAFIAFLAGASVSLVFYFIAHFRYGNHTIK